MNKEEIRTKVGGHDAKISFGNPIDKLAEQKRMDKLNAMRIALTYIESQGMIKVSPEEATKIADKFLKWLEK